MIEVWGFSVEQVDEMESQRAADALLAQSFAAPTPAAAPTPGQPPQQAPASSSEERGTT